MTLFQMVKNFDKKCGGCKQWSFVKDVIQKKLRGAVIIANDAKTQLIEVIGNIINECLLEKSI